MTRSTAARLQDIRRDLGMALCRLPEDDSESPLSGLEHYDRFAHALARAIPALLAEPYPIWRGQSFDDVYVAEVRRPDSTHATVAAMGLRIAEQALTPIQCQMRLHPDAPFIDHLCLRLGEPGWGVTKVAGRGYESVEQALQQLRQQAEQIDWIYRLTLLPQDDDDFSLIPGELPKQGQIDTEATAVELLRHWWGIERTRQPWLQAQVLSEQWQDGSAHIEFAWQHLAGAITAWQQMFCLDVAIEEWERQRCWMLRDGPCHRGDAFVAVLEQTTRMLALHQEAAER